MDTDDSGLLDLREFVEATKIVGYYGNVRALWYNLDDDQSGYISLTEIDPVASAALEKFRAQCTSIFGSMEAAWDGCLDKDRSGALTLPELEEASLELGYTDMEEVRELFGLLRLEPSAFRIMKHEVSFLQKWEDRKQKTFARSWRAGSRWVNKDPYLWKDAKHNRKVQPQDETVPRMSNASPESVTPAPPLPQKLSRIGDAEGVSRLCSPVSEPAPVNDLKGSSKFHLFRKYAARGASATPSQHGRTTPHGQNAVAEAEQFEVKSDSAETVYTDIVAIDKQRAWDEFEAFLIHTFGCLSKAFDTMDTSGNGSLDREEWMHTVTRRLRFCRASEALRLFDSKVSEGNVIKWNDLGITPQEWMQYTLEKRTKEQEWKNRNINMKPPAFGGNGMRRVLAGVDHNKRMKCKPKKPDEAFWTALPTGWGFPAHRIYQFENSVC
jgi:Ca2+-binding EF-hand superfamily protein